MTTDDEHRFLTQAELEVSGRFDRSVLTLSGGALALSMTFLKDIVPNAKAVWVLGISWFFLAVAILAIMISLNLSQLGLRKQRELNALAPPKGKIPINSAADATNVLNWIALAFLVLGILGLANFAFRNVWT